MTHAPTLSRRPEMQAWAARSTVISNLDPDGAVWYFFTAQLMRATVILNSNSLSGELFPGRNYAILLPGSAF